MRFLKTVIIATLLTFSLASNATEVECKRWDSKCIKAQKKAEFTQAYFRILDAGVKAGWDVKKVRGLFTKEEQRELKKIGLDVTSARLVQAISKKYEASFSDLDATAWQSVLDSILHADYVAKQVKYKLMNVAVVERLRNELENSGKKTVKAKSGNFSTRSSSRPAVVVLEDMRRAQSTLMKELSKAGDALDIDILSEALEETTIILVSRNEQVTKALSNPREFEKALSKASASSGMPLQAVLQQMSVAGKPAIDVVLETAKRQMASSKQVADMETQHGKKIDQATLTQLVVMATLKDIPNLPTDLSGFSREDLAQLYPESTDDDYSKMMREYARYAKLQEADAISIDTDWTKGEPGYLYRNAMNTVFSDAIGNGSAAEALIQKMDAETAEIWVMLKALEARVKVGQNALDQEIKIEELREANGTEYTDEEEYLEELHWNDSGEIAQILETLMENTHAATLLSNDQLTYAENLFDDAYKLIKVSRGSDFLDDLQKSMNEKSAASMAILDRQLKLAEQEANNDIAGLVANKAYAAMASTSIAKEYAKDMAQQIEVLVTSGQTYDAAFEAVQTDENMEVIFSAFDHLFEMVESDEIDKDLGMQAIYNLRDLGIELKLNEYTDGQWNQMVVDLKLEMDGNAAIGSLHDQMEQKFENERLATEANMIELADEIAKIQNEIDNIQSEYDKAISMGASPSEAAAYMQDQEEQRRAGMAELCAAGDANAC